MNKVEGLQELTGDFDSLLYYDKKALEERMYEWLAKKKIVKNMLKEKISKEVIFRIVNLSEKEFSEMLNEIKEESEIPEND